MIRTESFGCSRAAADGASRRSRSCRAPGLPRAASGSQLRAERRIGGRRGIEPAQKGADVEPGPADDDGQSAPGADRLNGAQGVGAKARGVVAIVGSTMSIR